MIIRNGLVYTKSCTFQQADIAIEGERITMIAPPGTLPAEGAVDAGGGYVLPGFVDIHSHGVVGVDFCDGDTEGLKKTLAFYGGIGVTSVVPATMSLPEEDIAKAIRAALPLFEEDGHGAVLRGINMEGPFINPGKKGAQKEENIYLPNNEIFARLFELAKGYVKLVDIAPEMPGSIEFIRENAGRCAVSLAHTAANYDEAAAAFAAGASHVTHLFNAMPPFNHRDPGVVGAASDFASFVEIISDGIHLHPAVVRAVFQWFGEARVCLVSDSMRGTGMPNGQYDLGGQMVTMQDGKALLADGTIAGSAVTLPECCRRAIKFGVPMEAAVRAATLNPAKAAGLLAEVGTLEAGKRADVLIWDRELNTKQVIVGGKSIAG